MGQPYKRIMVTTLVIMATFLPALALGSPVPVLIIIIAIKIGMDIWMHNRSHRATPGKATDEVATRIPAADD